MAEQTENNQSVSREDIEFNYSQAEFYPNGTEVTREEAIETLFGGTCPVAGELLPMINHGAVGVPTEPYEITEIRVESIDNDMARFKLRIPGLTVGRQVDGGDHPTMVAHSAESFKHFRIGIE